MLIFVQIFPKGFAYNYTLYQMIITGSVSRIQ